MRNSWYLAIRRQNIAQGTDAFESSFDVDTFALTTGVWIQLTLVNVDAASLEQTSREVLG